MPQREGVAVGNDGTHRACSFCRALKGIDISADAVTLVFHQQDGVGLEDLIKAEIAAQKLLPYVRGQGKYDLRPREGGADAPVQAHKSLTVEADLGKRLVPTDPQNIPKAVIPMHHGNVLAGYACRPLVQVALGKLGKATV